MASLPSAESFDHFAAAQMPRNNQANLNGAYVMYRTGGLAGQLPSAEAPRKIYPYQAKRPVIPQDGSAFGLPSALKPSANLKPLPEFLPQKPPPIIQTIKSSKPTVNALPVVTGYPPSFPDLEFGSKAYVDRLFQQFQNVENSNRMKLSSYPPKSRLLVRNVFRNQVTKRDVFDLFWQMGEVGEIAMKDQFCFVQYNSPDIAREAMEKRQGFKLGLRLLEIEVSTTPGHKLERRAASQMMSRPLHVSSEQVCPKSGGQAHRRSSMPQQSIFDQRQPRARSRSPQSATLQSRYRTRSPLKQSQPEPQSSVYILHLADDSSYRVPLAIACFKRDNIPHRTMALQGTTLDAISQTLLDTLCCMKVPGAIVMKSTITSVGVLLLNYDGEYCYYDYYEKPGVTSAIQLYLAKTAAAGRPTSRTESGTAEGTVALNQRTRYPQTHNAFGSR